MSVPAVHSKPVRVLHLASGADGNPVINGMLLPLLVRGDRRTVQPQVVHFMPGHPHAAIARQSGVPVHEISLSRRRWSLLAPQELAGAVRDCAPDVIHAWGYTAQLAAFALRRFVAPRARMIFSLCGTDPLPAHSGPLDRLKLKMAMRCAGQAGQLVYASETALSRHRRAGFPAGNVTVIAPGVDVERYKPDFAARKRVREQLQLPANAFVIGMQAPFQSEYDHVTFFKAAGDVIRANPHTQILLAGRGVQRGNAPLMALVGGGTLATRVHLLGEWSDSAALFNACDVVCSTALTDELRSTLMMAMLCGVPCVATGPGAQGEVVGKSGASVEPGGEASLLRGITRIMEMPAERRAFLARTARQHALANFNLQRAIQRYHALYREEPDVAVTTVNDDVSAANTENRLTAA